MPHQPEFEKKQEKNYIVMLYQQGVGVIAFDNLFFMDHVQAVKTAMNRAFDLFPSGKFALHGYEIRQGDSSVRVERVPRYLGKL